MTTEDSANLSRLSSRMRDMMFRVAEDGEEGLAAALSERPQLILCDVRMPKKDGLAFLREYRDSGGEALVLVMTAYGGMELAVEAMKAGAYDYLPKPFGADEVLLTVRKAEERGKPQRRGGPASI